MSKTEIKTEILLHQLPVCTAFDFTHPKEKYPYVISSSIPDISQRVQIFSLETGDEYYSHVDRVISPISEFLFMQEGGYRYWVHGDTASIVESYSIDELGKLTSFTVKRYCSICIVIPSDAKCVFEF